ncbi:MAG: metallophosphoesterase [Phycisphaerae bacterium]|nr:metallophosphoesterase [Phycisphaerae bacterium]
MTKPKSCARVLIAASCLSICWQARLDAEPVSGAVFLDANRNGRQDEGEKGIPNVPVSDTLAFVVTNEAGRYQIDAKVDPLRAEDKKPIVALTIPSGYAPTKTWFRRIEAPADTSHADFGLERQEQRLPFIFAHGSDCHVPRGGKDLFPKFKEDLRQLAHLVRFCVLTGDLADLPDREPQAKGLAQYKLLGEYVQDFPVPLFCTPGNHDVTGYNAQDKWDKTHPMYGYGAFTHTFGPMRWSFNYAGVHLVGLDFLDCRNGKWSQRLPDQAAQWLRRDLDLAPKAAPVLLFIHHHHALAGVTDVIKQHPVKMIFDGHGHNVVAASFAGTTALMGGALSVVGGPYEPGYRLVLVTDKEIETFYKATGKPHAFTLDLPRAGDVLENQTPVKGAFFDAPGEIKQLSVRLGKVSKPVPFTRTPICCRFETTLDLDAEPAGLRKLVLEAVGGKTPARYERKVLLRGKDDPRFRPEPAELQIDLVGVDRNVTVLLNGKSIGTIAPTKVRGDGSFPTPVKKADTVSLKVGPDALKRLNEIDLQPGRHDNGNPDVFCICDLRLRFDGAKQPFRDTRFPHGPNRPRRITQNTKYYVDLMPD